VGVQSVHNQTLLDRIRIALVEQLLDPHRPILSGATRSHRCMSFDGQWSYFHKYFIYPVSDVFVVNASWLSRCIWYRLADSTDYLFARFVHAQYRVARIKRQMINFQDILHAGNKSRTPFGRVFPILAEVRFKFGFFKTRGTVICDTDAANLKSKALSATSLTIQRPHPFWVSEQANAINLASKAPSDVTSRGGFFLGLRSNAISSPSSMKRLFEVFNRQALYPNAVATPATFHAEPSVPASYRKNNAWEWTNLLVWFFPLRVVASS
jgi:hypothetical protein